MPLPESAPNFVNFLQRLRAVRQFKPDPLPKDVFDAILKVVRWSGSAGNQQPWELVIVRERQTLQALAGAQGYVSHIGGAAAGILLVMNGDPSQHDQETYDEGRISERIMLAAEAYGVGSCIGWYFGEGPKQVKTLLGIPESKFVRTAISLGYPDPDYLKNRPKPAQARKPLSEIAHWERYS